MRGGLEGVFWSDLKTTGYLDRQLAPLKLNESVTIEVGKGRPWDIEYQARSYVRNHEAESMMFQKGNESFEDNLAAQKFSGYVNGRSVSADLESYKNHYCVTEILDGERDQFLIDTEDWTSHGVMIEGSPRYGGFKFRGGRLSILTYVPSAEPNDDMLEALAEDQQRMDSLQNDYLKAVSWSDDAPTLMLTYREHKRACDAQLREDYGTEGIAGAQPV
ncbi:hypothetical protein Slin14017_G130620 [Septoria linicola]|nr:hypothetical protein Slin14017_G130620 [Septoria linicola]